MLETSTLGPLVDALRDYDDVRIGDARALPMEAYTSAELFDLEMEGIFRRDWICVGRTEQVARSGDWFTTEVAGEPIVVTAGSDGEIRAMSAVCRHRYMAVASGSGNSRRLTCPYHRWSYDLDGTLLGTPLMDTPVRPDGTPCSLPGYQVETWLGFVFVSLAANPEPLTPQLVGAKETLDPYQMEDWRILIAFDEVWAGNWKLGLETALEGYHLDGLHGGEIAAMMPSKGCQFVEATDRWSCFRLEINFESEFGAPTKPFADAMGGLDAVASPTVSIHPNVNISCSPASTTWLTFMPLEIGTTQVRGGYLVPPDEYERIHAAEGELEFTQAAIAQLNREDSSAMIDLQRSAHSRFAEPGVLCEKEEALIHFYRYLAGRLHNEGARP